MCKKSPPASFAPMASSGDSALDLPCAPGQSTSVFQDAASSNMVGNVATVPVVESSPTSMEVMSQITQLIKVNSLK